MKPSKTAFPVDAIARNLNSPSLSEPTDCRSSPVAVRLINAVIAESILAGGTYRFPDSQGVEAAAHVRSGIIARGNDCSHIVTVARSIALFLFDVFIFSFSGVSSRKTAEIELSSEVQSHSCCFW